MQANNRTHSKLEAAFFSQLPQDSRDNVKADVESLSRRLSDHQKGLCGAVLGDLANTAADFGIQLALLQLKSLKQLDTERIHQIYKKSNLGGSKWSEASDYVIVLSEFHGADITDVNSCLESLLDLSNLDESGIFRNDIFLSAWSKISMYTHDRHSSNVAAAKEAARIARAAARLAKTEYMASPLLRGTDNDEMSKFGRAQEIEQLASAAVIESIWHSGPHVAPLRTTVCAIHGANGHGK